MKIDLSKYDELELHDGLALAKAITEPVKVKAPMATPIDISISAWVWMCPTVPMPKASGA